MKILYMGSVCDKERYNIMQKKNPRPYYTAQYMFEMSLIEGFSKNNVDMSIYCIVQEPNYPNASLYFRNKEKKINEKYSVKYISFINLIFLKEVMFLLNSFCISLSWCLKNINEKEKIILTPFNYPPVSIGLWFASKICGVKRVNIFTDLSQDIMTKERQKKVSKIKRIIMPIYSKLIKKTENSYDMYVLFTKYMNDLVNSKKKPSIVMEGIYNDMNSSILDEKKERAIMYAGTLSWEYGIGNVLDAYQLINDKEIELWIFGSGDAEKEIIKLAEQNSKIKFFGFKTREEVLVYQKKATLLVNFRNSNDRYTKYSFPSKTFEYMASGTPFLTTKLAGIPEEYYDFLYTVEYSKAEDLSRRIDELFEEKPIELDEFGLRARNFILTKKNNIVQSEKIISFFKKNYK